MEDLRGQTPSKKIRMDVGKETVVSRKILQYQPIVHRAGTGDGGPHHQPSHHGADGGAQPSREQWCRPHHHPINIVGDDGARTRLEILVG